MALGLNDVVKTNLIVIILTLLLFSSVIKGLALKGATLCEIKLLMPILL